MLLGSHCTYSLNIHLYEENGIITMWDGESKFLIEKKFDDGFPVFRIFNGGTLRNPTIKSQIVNDILDRERDSSFVSDDNAHQFDMLHQAINSYVNQRHSKEHTDEFMTSDWLLDNDFGDWVKKITKK